MEKRRRCRTKAQASKKPKVGLVRFLRGVLVLGLLVTFLALFAKSVDRYRKGRIATDAVDVETRDFVFPAVAVCASVTSTEPLFLTPPLVVWARHYLRLNDTYGENLFVNYGATHRAGVNLNTTHDGRWDTFDFRDETGNRVYCNKYSPPEHYKTPYGIGHTLTFGLQSRTVSSALRYLSVTLGESTTMSWLGAGVFGKTVNLIPAARATENSLKVVLAKLGFAERVKLPTEERPCYPTGEVAVPLETCVNEFLSKQVEEGKDVTDVVAGLQDMSEMGVILETGCLPPCRITTYSFSTAAVLDYDMSPELATTDLMLSLYAESPVTSVEEDYLVYDGYELFADGGGLVGVLLGMSCITVYDQILELTQIFRDLMGFKSRR